MDTGDFVFLQTMPSELFSVLADLHFRPPLRHLNHQPRSQRVTGNQKQ